MNDRGLDRRGMTLVELLVVVAILGLLSAVVLPTIGGSIDRRRYREGARNLSSFVARAQSRAINAPGPRGLMIQPLAADPDAAIDMYFANAPEVYGGESQDSLASVTPFDRDTPLVSGTVPVRFLRNGASDGPTMDRLADPDFCAAGDSIQFGGSGPYFKLIPPTRDDMRAFIGMWADANQSPRNTAWPRMDGGAEFRILRQPRRASSGLLQLQSGVALDIAWSCLGSRPLGKNAGMTPVIDAGARAKPITILFDVSGRPSELVHSGGRRTRISEPLFLLLGSSQLAGNDYVPSLWGNAGTDPEERGGANWQYADSIWLCIDSNTGVVKFGPVKPQATTLRESQRFVRQTVGTGVSE